MPTQENTDKNAQSSDVQVKNNGQQADPQLQAAQDAENAVEKNSGMLRGFLRGIRGK